MNVCLRLILLAVAVMASVGCSQGRTLIVEKAALVEEPYPAAYPGVGPNRTLAQLANTRVRVLDDNYGKDFHVYHVRTNAGLQGYIIDLPGVKETAEPCR